VECNNIELIVGLPVCLKHLQLKLHLTGMIQSNAIQNVSVV